MKKYHSVLQKTKLFEGFSTNEIELILPCLNGKVIFFKKDTCILNAGDSIKKIGLLLNGAVKISRSDINGEVQLVDELRAGDMFGEAFIYAEINEIPVNVWAMEATEVLFLDYKNMLTSCKNACDFHQKLISNMIKNLAIKLIALSNKIEVVQKPTIKDKLMAYFELSSVQQGSKTFNIAFNQTELAAYLGIHRSAMARELGKLRRDGTLQFKGKEIVLLK